MRKILFTIERLEFIGSGKFMVGGRNCEAELKKGDVLNVICEAVPYSIDVTLDEITMYNNTVTEVPHGLTAGLIFDNEIAKNFTLGGTLEGEQKA